MNSTKTKPEKSNSDNKYGLLKFILSTIISIIITYVTVTWAFNKQRNEGKYLAFEITSLYSFNLVNNGMDIVNGKYKNSKSDKDMYMKMLKQIDNQWYLLTSNPYYVDLIKKYPKISSLKLITSNEIYRLENMDSLETQIACHVMYFELYDMIKKDLPKRFFKEKGGKYYNLDKDVTWLKNEINTKKMENNIFHNN